MLAWANATLSELEGQYDHLPAQKSQKLPDAVAAVARRYVATEDPNFPISGLEQAYTQVFEVELSIMVDNANPQTAATLLGSMADRLEAEALKSITLGGRVQIRSPFVSFNFDNPHVRYDDGTEGREMVMTILVGDLVKVDDF